MADSLHRLPSTPEELQIVIPSHNWTLLLQGRFRISLLVPFVYVNNHRVGPLPARIQDEPRRAGTLLQELRNARDRGRLSDLAASQFRRKLQFERPKLP